MGRVKKEDQKRKFLERASAYNNRSEMAIDDQYWYRIGRINGWLLEAFGEPLSGGRKKVFKPPQHLADLFESYKKFVADGMGISYDGTKDENDLWVESIKIAVINNWYTHVEPNVEFHPTVLSELQRAGSIAAQFETSILLHPIALAILHTDISFDVLIASDLVIL